MGQLLRIAVVLIGIWLVVRLIKRYLTQQGKGRVAQGERQKMLACAHCGVYVPQSEAVYDGGKAYCCRDHVRAGRGTGE